MDPSEARRRFSTRAGAADDEIELVEMALWIAAEEVPTLATDEALAAIASLAAAAPTAAGSRRDRVEAVNHYFFAELGFAGNSEDYYDPRNSYLHEVVARRTGIPISLAIVYMSVARAAGLQPHGIGFPGHFLVGFSAAEEDLFVDPFGGQILETRDCEQLLRGMFGPESELEAHHLAPASNAQILLRVLANLKQIFSRDQAWDRAIACCERSLLLHPDLPSEIRDRGLLYFRAECFRAAREDLERYQTLVPDAGDNRMVDEVLSKARSRAERLI